MSSHHSRNHHCQNCGSELKGPYCHHCGQHDFDPNSSFGHTLHEFLESFLHWDGKFFRGVFDLLFRPGYLTVAYNAGRRASQIPPLRFYIFVSLIFFLTPSAEEPSAVGSVNFDDEPAAPAATVPTALPAQAAATARPGAQPGPAAPAAGTRAQVAPAPAEKEDETGRLLREKLSHPDRIRENFNHYLPRAVLVCLPLFALMSMLVYRKSGYRFLQHLVLSMHLHTFFFLFTLAWGGWRGLAGLVSPLLSGWLYFLGCLYIVIYAYLTLRRVFAGVGRRGTLLRGGLLLGGYGMVVGIVMLVTISIATWLS
jgi:hypothetical protein